MLKSCFVLWVKANEAARGLVLWWTMWLFNRLCITKCSTLEGYRGVLSSFCIHWTLSLIILDIKGAVLSVLRFHFIQEAAWFQACLCHVFPYEPWNPCCDLQINSKHASLSLRFLTWHNIVPNKLALRHFRIQSGYLISLFIEEKCTTTPGTSF